MDIKICKAKFEELFRQFFKEGYVLSGYYSEKLLNYLENDPDKCAVKVIETPFFSDLIIQTLQNIEKTSESVRVFIIEVLYVMLKNELQFSKIYHIKGIKEALRELFLINKSELLPSVAVALAGIKYYDASLSHSTGLEENIKNKVWKTLLDHKIPSRIYKIDVGARDLTCKVVWKINECNLEDDLAEILSNIVDPIRNYTKQHITSHNIMLLDDQDDVYKAIFASLKILEVILSSAENVTCNNLVVPLLINYLKIETPLILLAETTRNSDLAYLIGNNIFLLNFACMTINGLQRDKTNIPSMSVITYHNVTNSFIEKRHFQAIMQFSVSCYKFWTKLDSKIIPHTFERSGKTFDVRSQFLPGILLPLIKCSSTLSRDKPFYCYIEEAFFCKINNLVTEHITKNALLMKAMYDDCENIKRAGIAAIKNLFDVTKCLSEHHAGIVYQTLFYVLQSYATIDEHNTLTVDESPAKCPDDIKLVHLTLDLIKILLTKYEIKWYESVEIISLQNCLMNLLKRNVLPSKQMLQALDLIDLSIKKFLSPDLALLIESRQGNTLNEIVAVISILIQHPDWGLRDSAINVLLTCTELAYIHYTPLQKLIQENRLIPLATHAALSDEEPYVRAVASRVLAAATKIESLWNEALTEMPQLCMQLIHILKTNPEGIIRKEAAYILTQLYIQQKLSVEFTNRLYDVMVSAAVDDLHWEVQLTALSFWKSTIDDFLSQRGMIDGKFPVVTFCKRKRKIITLDEKTIHIQLAGTMNDLAAAGCLKVLNECVNEECSIVKEKAYEIAKDLLSLLEFYNFNSVPEDMLVDNVEPTYPNNDNLNSLLESIDITSNSESKIRDDVIDSILETTQCDLIQDLYDKFIEIKSNSMEDEIVTAPMDKWLEPNVFINNFKAKLTENIEIRKSWNSGFKGLEELLDELLTLGEVKRNYIEECD